MGDANTTMTLEQRTLRARIAAHASWATTTDRGEKARKGADALLARFEAQVDPDRVLPASQRATDARTFRTQGPHVGPGGQEREGTKASVDLRTSIKSLRLQHCHGR